MTTPFIDRKLNIEDYWRGIILYGRNVASYKFALAKTLLESRPAAGELVKLGSLAPVFARHIAEHLRMTDRQGTSASSRFLSACRLFNAGEIDQTSLVDQTVRFGFSNVIDAFHVVGSGETAKRFFIDERQANAGIRITDEFSILADTAQFENLEPEAEARWRLVETAWEMGVSRGLLAIDYDTTTERLFAIDSSRRRRSVTSSRDTLNGYQNGSCFYCFSEIEIFPSASPLKKPDVDHCFPHSLKQLALGGNIDGVWNLVLSCKDCNRGPRGKFERLPSISLLGRLHRRNEYLISSHHPLRETLIKQTGTDSSDRQTFLQNFYDSMPFRGEPWEPSDQAQIRF